MNLGKHLFLSALLGFMIPTFKFAGGNAVRIVKWDLHYIGP